MIRSYLKIAIRALMRDKLGAFINVFGLALAMGCSVVIYLYVMDELAYDSHHVNRDRIYRVTRNFRSPDGSVTLHLGHVASPFAPLLKIDFPEIDAVARTLKSRLLVTLQSPDDETGKSFYEPNIYFADPEIFEVFSISVVSGSPHKVLDEPNQLMLSETTARKYFGTVDPLGKSMRLANMFNVVVSAVFKDFPNQSHWHPDMLLSFATLNDPGIYGREQLETNFSSNPFGTYILVKESFESGRIEAQFPAFLDRHVPHSGNDVKPSLSTALFLQPVRDIHLRSHLDSEEEANGNINNVYMIGVIGVFIVLIACFNFINLSTARASKRAKEVGVRKVVGAQRHQLVYQYLSESVLVAVFSLMLAVVLIPIALLWLNAFSGKAIHLSVLFDIHIVVAMVVYAMCVGLLAGVYPAFVLSGFKPALTLKGQQGAAADKGLLRKGLVVAQFSISIVLIISTTITFQQLQYLNQETLGYNREHIVTLPYYGDELNANYEAFYNTLTGESTVKNIARSSLVPTGRLLTYEGSARIQKGDSIAESKVVLKNVAIDPEFFDTYEVVFVAGRDYSKGARGDSLGFVLNEAAVDMLGFTNEDIVNRELEYGGEKGKVIGVVKDFHFESLYEPIVPMIFHTHTRFRQMSVRLTGNDVPRGLENIGKVWRQFLPHIPFEYSFLSESYSHLYKAEQKQSQLFIVFAGLSILIACLGLFGLASFNAVQRVKEIGIRKVLGASVSSILTLLTREIVILIVIANLIAWPVAWYFMNSWLSTFGYHVNMSPVTYVLAGVAAVGLALITVSAQTIRAATGNPTNSLRHE